MPPPTSAPLGERVSSPPARAFRRYLEGRGPLYVAIGQRLAMQPDRLASTWLRELLLLEESAPPMPFAEVRRRLNAEASRGAISPGELFNLEDLAPTPFRSTLLSQTHPARWRGEDVAVKVRRPGVRQRIVDDLRPQRLARELSRSGELPFEGSLVEALGEIRDQLVGEIDLAAEAQNLQQLDQAARGEQNLPRVYPELSSERVLTRQRRDGVPLLRLLSPTPDRAVREAAPDHEGVARSLTQTVVDEVFGAGMVHRFWHPDNLVALADGGVTRHDYGSMAALAEDSRAWQLRLFSETLEGDPTGMFQILQRELDLDPAGEEGLRRRFLAASRVWDLGKRARVETLSGEQRRPTRTSNRLVGLVRTLEDERIAAPGELPVVQRALAVVEEICWNLAPKAELRSLAGASLSRLALDRTLERLQTADMRPWLAALSLARQLPESLDTILRELAEGKLSLQLATTESEKSRRDRNRRTRLLVGALGSVGLAVLVAAPQPLGLFGVELTQPLALLLAALYLWLLVEAARRR